MKTKSIPLPRSGFGGRMCTASLLALGLLAGGIYAQSSSSSSSEPDTLRSNSSAADPARNGTYDPATSDPSTTGRNTSASSMDTRSSDDSSLKHGDKRFITKAAESTQREVALSQLAATRATNPQVRNYAQQLINGHQQMTQELVELAQHKGVVLDDVAALSTRNVSGSSNSTNSAAHPTAPGDNSSIAARNSGANPAPIDDPSRHAMTPGSSSSTSMATTGNNDATSDRHYRSLAKKSGAEFDKEYVELMIKEHKSDVKLFKKAAEDANDSDIRSFASRQLPSLQAHLDQASSLGQIAAE